MGRFLAQVWFTTKSEGGAALGGDPLERGRLYVVQATIAINVSAVGLLVGAVVELALAGGGVVVGGGDGL
ncbi:MAG TPA: hypothetical protein VGN01_09165 [Acidobacteriaceae bacterium]